MIFFELKQEKNRFSVNLGQSAVLGRLFGVESFHNPHRISKNPNFLDA
jgi:hypothetical protein